jgi:hypothetical protein
MMFAIGEQIYSNMEAIMAYQGEKTEYLHESTLTLQHCKVLHVKAESI